MLEHMSRILIRVKINAAPPRKSTFRLEIRCRETGWGFGATYAPYGQWLLPRYSNNENTSGAFVLIAQSALQNLSRCYRRAFESQFVDPPIMERSYEYALLRLPERFE